MKILHVSCSPRGQDAESYRLSQKIIGFLLQKNPQATVIDRMIGIDVITPIEPRFANSPAAPLVPTQADTVTASEALIDELESADVVVIGTPMHNLTLPSSLKAWIDNVVRAGRTFTITPAGKIGTLRDRPVYIAVSSGGRFSGELARQPDFLTPYLSTIFKSIGLESVTFFSVQGTAAGPDILAENRANTDHQLQTYFTQ